jgi:hypothetical protein
MRTRLKTDLRFSQWESIDTLNMRTRLKTDLRFSHGREPVQMCTLICFGEVDRFSHRTQIRFSEFSVQFIGSSCSSHLGLLLFSCCYYFFPIALILFLLLLLFSHAVALSVWWSHLIINYLIIKKILINEKFNNQVVKTGCENRLLLYIWESTYLRTGWVWKKTWSVLTSPKKYVY